VPPRRELARYTKAPVIVPSSTPSYNSHYTASYLEGQAEAPPPAEVVSFAALEALVECKATRGYMRVTTTTYMIQPLVELYGGCMAALKASRCGITPRPGTCGSWRSTSRAPAGRSGAGVDGGLPAFAPSDLLSSSSYLRFSYSSGGLYGGLYGRAYVIRCFPRSSRRLRRAHHPLGPAAPAAERRRHHPALRRGDQL
jgi:hypothetical protein